MAEMTDEEADYWDEFFTKNPPKVSGGGKSGFFVKHRGNIVILDDFSAAYLHARAEGAHKTPADIIGELVREKIAAAEA
jgi:hypothetical protein